MRVLDRSVGMGVVVVVVHVDVACVVTVLRVSMVAMVIVLVTVAVVTAGVSSLLLGWLVEGEVIPSGCFIHMAGGKATHEPIRERSVAEVRFDAITTA